jgi:hypothetical protein
MKIINTEHVEIVGTGDVTVDKSSEYVCKDHVSIDVSVVMINMTDT